VFTAFLVTGRAGSAMAAEIGSMRVGEQLDALRVMSISPRSYLVMPRVLASVFMLPLLSGIFLLVGMTAAMLVAIFFFQVPSAIFLDKVAWVCKWTDLVIGLQKAAFFGLAYSTISCFFGFYTSGGAEGVGRATTRSVVVSLFIVILADFVLSYAFFDINDKILN
jgi:phospholipid/cholesterol/gamma-HCH transport system permease protein